MLEEERDVFDAIPQRRDVHADHVQPEEEVLAEVAGRDFFRKIAVSGRDQTNVDARVRAIGADALNLAGLEEAQEHDLHAGAHLADFIEEHGAVGRHLQQPGLIAVRAREAAAHVTEQFRLQQRIGQASAIDGDQPARRAGTAIVNEARDDFLAHTRLACDEHLGAGSRRAVDVGQNGSDRFASTEQTHFGIWHPRHRTPLIRRLALPRDPAVVRRRCVSYRSAAD